MNLKKIKYYNIASKTLCHENYFEVTQNYSFTNFSLKQKRILAFLLQKLMMVPDLQKTAFDILTYFLQSYNSTKEKIEEELCEVFYFIIIH